MFTIAPPPDVIMWRMATRQPSITPRRLTPIIWSHFSIGSLMESNQKWMAALLWRTSSPPSSLTA